MDPTHSAAFAFEIGTATHVGRVRTLNEDGLIARRDIGLWAVADGMGGHAGGDLASATLVEALGSIQRVTSAPDLLAQVEEQVIRANGALRAVAKADGGEIIGTTLAAVLAYGRHYACVWSGDSRVYLWRRGDLRQITRDHTELQDLLDRGILAPDEARSWPRRNVITRAIGVHDEAEMEFREGTLEDNDRFLLCSDGLTAHVEPDEIARLVGHARPQAVCDALVGLTLDRGATDNVTVVVVACVSAARTVRF